MDISVRTTDSGSPSQEPRPEGYTEQFGSSRWECDRCGARVGRTDLHDAFHDRVDPPPPPPKEPRIHEWPEDLVKEMDQRGQ